MKTAYRKPSDLVALVIVLSAALAPACGGDDFTFGGGDGNSPTKVTVTGNIRNQNPVTSRDVVVFAYNVDNVTADTDKCPCPTNPCPSSAVCPDVTGKTTVLADGATDFTLSGIEPGALRVVFLLDKAGSDADGEINAGDPVAVLDDTDCQLTDVGGKLTVTLKDVDIDFAAVPDDCSTGSPPAAGRARADQITKTTTTTTNADSQP